tara:strand:+ start:363 stop:962 length:600 start_codon:yes stop_codon:yes gene_type:complete
MPAKSKAQQRFFGMVRAAQKGEGASSPEVAKVADEISNKDAKKYAKTKHKGLPEKKEVKEEKKGRHPRDQKELDRAVAYIKKNPNFGKKDVKEDKLAEGDVPRGPGGNPIRIKDKIKAAKGFIPHKGKPTVEIKESVLDVVRKYGKKKQEKKSQKAQDAGARARRVMQRKEYASKVSGSTDNVPDNLRDSLQILRDLIR